MGSIISTQLRCHMGSIISLSREQIDGVFFELHIEEKLNCHPQCKKNLIRLLL